ncbi:Modifier of snc1 [Thalictrum thalictroides]|uniref:Modifier of snc1 n=1 Tax=Thalictrum thalictroides TaxID=46969 RepID=A0A7J6WJB3_THATH|nr:Modifier of snc1 [Thalictrum thalictroides]
MLGERRWLPARRGGMTVLGKVTVPKPINLPSQKLENHGLDPNVEIVPKGTLNWGTRSSSSAHNVWASPAQSPPKIGGAGGSPSHFNGRPSSSGSGTRPSTAGSDKSHEPVPNVWGPNSRPSSSSGVLASNQTSLAASRPRSAEPRPASSQLSRFAEPIADNSATWGAPGTMEKLGVSSSKNKDFALSSGDFPTLGTEKTTETLVRQGHSSQGRPVSASGRPATPKQRSETSPSEEGSFNANEERGIVSTLKNGNILEVEAGDPPSIENWQRSYPDQNLHPQQYGPWHGTPPHNPPNGVWYRGPFVGPPYGPPGPPGSYPHEPYPYYQPRFPGRPPANLQPVMQPGSAPSGYYPDKGDSHRPHMPDSYIRPVMPFGPGPYPVPMPYDGYYGPPRAGSCIPNERRPPVMGMAGAPCVYNRYPMQNAPHDHPGNFHGSSGYGPPNTKAKEQVGSGHPHGSRQGPYKVLLKHQDGWDANESTDRRDHTVNIPCLERDNHQGKPTREIGPGVDRRHDEQVSSSKVPRVSSSSQSIDSRRGNTQVVVDLDLPEGAGKVNRVEDSFARKPEIASNAEEDPHQIMSTKRNPTLIEQIEQLNNKARKSEGRYGAGHNEKLKSLRVLTPEVDDAPNEAGRRLDCSNEAPTGVMLSSPTFGMNPSRDKRHEATAFIKEDASRPVHEPHAPVVRPSSSSSDVDMIHHNAQKRPYGLQGRTDNRGKARSNPPKDEEWRKKAPVTDFSAEVHPIKDEICDDNVVDHHGAVRVSEKTNLIQGKAGGELPALDPSDHQRAKMREIAAERAKQLQKEEEERTREQKARALAKLEELNRRTLAEVSTEKVDHASPQIEAQQNKRDSQLKTSPVTDANTYNEVVSSSSGWNCDSVTLISDCDTHGQGSTDLPIKVPLETPLSAQQDPGISNNLSVPLPLEVDANVVVDHKTSQGHDTIALKPKQIGHKRKQSTNKSLSDKSISTGHSGHVKSDLNVAVDVNSHGNTNTTDDGLPKQKKKNNKNGKNKHKLDEVSAGARSPKLVLVDGNSTKSSAEISKRKTTVSVFEVGSVQVPFSIENAETQDSASLSTDQGWSLPTEEVKTIVNNQLKPQSSRRPRSTQGTRITEKFHGTESVVWAPVASLRKTEDSEDATVSSTIEVHTSSVVGRGTQSNHKSRRAEMERYVPKPVAKEAKEHSTQGNTDQMPASSVNQGASNVSSGRPESMSLNKEISGPDLLSVGKEGVQAVTKIGESKHNKHGKTHGLWRPRASGEVPLAEPSLEESCYLSDPSKTVQKPSEQQQSPNQEIYLSKEQAKYPDSSKASTSLISNETVSDRAMKDRGLTNRGKRQAFKGHKGAEHSQNNLDHKDLHGADTVEAGSRTSIESNKLDGRISLGEKQAVDTHASSHWQPKSQGYMPHNHQGSSRVNGGQRVSSRVGKAPKADYPNHRGEHQGSRTDKEYSEALVHPHSDKSNEQKTVVAGQPNVHQQEAKPERKRTDSPKQGPCFVDKHSPNPAKLDSPANVDSPHEQPNSGLRRHEHQSGRFVRGHGASYGPQNPGVHDNSRQQLPSSNDKRRHDSHYEYQRARSSANESIESFEEGPRVTDSVEDLVIASICLFQEMAAWDNAMVRVVYVYLQKRQIKSVSENLQEQEAIVILIQK